MTQTLAPIAALWILLAHNPLAVAIVILLTLAASRALGLWRA